jgi:8-oxo-dGTP diphosphatase
VLAFPGGKVDGGTLATDILESTLRREIQEEAGIEVGESMTYVESVSFEGNGVYCLSVVFLCEYRSGTPRIDDPGEVAAIHWMTAQNVLDHPDAPPWLKQSIAKAERIRTRLTT